MRVMSCVRHRLVSVRRCEMAEIVSLEQRAELLLRRHRDELPREVQLVRADSIHATPIRWLWKGWLARGKLHILAGAPGTGKTTLSLGLAASITNGGCLPDGTKAAIGSVLIWSGEDDPADTLKPRLAAAGANMAKVHFVGDVGCGQDLRPFDPAKDMESLEFAANAIGDVALLIADPVVSAVSGDSHKSTEVRRSLQPLINLASHLDCAVLGISHFSKGTAGREPLERVTGSIAFGAVARIVLAAAKGEDGGRLLARAKSNIGPDGGGFAYDLDLMNVDGIEASRVTWGQPLAGSARELLGDAEEVGESPVDDAATWLMQMLAGAEVAVSELKKQATAAGYSWRTIERAKSNIGALAERISDGNSGAGRWCWRWDSKAANGNTASPATRFGGLAEKQLYQGLHPSQDCNTANSQSDNVVAGLPSDEVIL